MVDLLTLLPALISFTVISFSSSILCLRFYPVAPTACLWVLAFTVLLILQTYFLWFGQPLLMPRYADDITAYLRAVNSIHQLSYLLGIACLLAAVFTGRTSRTGDTPLRGRGPMLLMQGVLSLLLLPPLGIVVIVCAAWSLHGRHSVDAQDRSLTLAGLILGILSLALIVLAGLIAFWYVNQMASFGVIR